MLIVIVIIIIYYQNCLYFGMFIHFFPKNSTYMKRYKSYLIFI